jgi:hypothetical protein
VEEDSVLKAYVLTEVNEHIAEVAAEQDADAPEWEFFCECGRADCEERVRLKLEAYVALHDDGAVLAPGHHIDQIERARRLREDAKALRAQAEQQVKRVRQSLGKRKPNRALAQVQHIANMLDELADARTADLGFTMAEVGLKHQLRSALIFLNELDGPTLTECSVVANSTGAATPAELTKAQEEVATALAAFKTAAP